MPWYAVIQLYSCILAYQGMIHFGTFELNAWVNEILLQVRIAPIKYGAKSLVTTNNCGNKTRIAQIILNNKRTTRTLLLLLYEVSIDSLLRLCMRLLNYCLQLIERMHFDTLMGGSCYYSTLLLVDSIAVYIQLCILHEQLCTNCMCLNQIPATILNCCWYYLLALSIVVFKMSQGARQAVVAATLQ